MNDVCYELGKWVTYETLIFWSKYLCLFIQSSRFNVFYEQLLMLIKWANAQIFIHTNVSICLKNRK